MFCFCPKTRFLSKYLLVSVGKITKIASFGSCSYEEVDEYKKYLGRLFIRLETGRQQLWCFNYSSFCDKAIMEEIRPRIYEEVIPLNAKSLYLSYSDLLECIEGVSGRMDSIRGFFI